MLSFGVNLTSIEKNEKNSIENTEETTPCIGSRSNDCVEICIYDTSETIKYKVNGNGGVVDIWIDGCSSGIGSVFFCDNCPTMGNISKSQFAGEVCSGNPCTNYTITITYKKRDGTHCSEYASFCW